MKIEKLIEILDREEAERLRGMVTVSLELLNDVNFDWRPFLADAFSKRMARKLDRELTNTAEWIPSKTVRQVENCRSGCQLIWYAKDDIRSIINPVLVKCMEHSGWLSKLEKLLRSQSGRDRLSKSLPGVEKAEKGRGANRSKKHIPKRTQFPHTLDADLNPIRPS